MTVICAFPHSHLGCVSKHSKVMPGTKKLKSLSRDQTRNFQSDSRSETNRKKNYVTSESVFVSKNYDGDVFSVQDLAHLPVISSSAQVHVNRQVSNEEKLSPSSPQLCCLQTPENRPGRDANSSGNVSRRSWGFLSLMPSPSKLIFSPTRQTFSPSVMSSPKFIGEL